MKNKRAISQTELYDAFIERQRLRKAVSDMGLIQIGVDGWRIPGGATITARMQLSVLLIWINQPKFVVHDDGVWSVDNAIIKIKILIQDSFEKFAHEFYKDEKETKNSSKTLAR